MPSSCLRGILSDHAYLHLEFNDRIHRSTYSTQFARDHIYILHVEVIVALDVGFRFNPVPITSHFGINSRLIFFSTVYSPAYYSNKIPDVSITCYNQRSSRITLEKKKCTLSIKQMKGSKKCTLMSMGIPTKLIF